MLFTTALLKINFNEIYNAEVPLFHVAVGILLPNGTHRFFTDQQIKTGFSRYRSSLA